MTSIPSIGSVVAYQQALLSQQVQIAAMAKTNDVVEAQGEAVLELLEAAVQLSEAAASGSGIDIVA